MKLTRSIRAGKFLKSPDACILLLATLVWAWPSGLQAVNTLAQSRDKSLQRLESYSTDPLQIVEVRSANKTVTLGKEFNGGDDWLKATTLTVKNVSGKDIMFIEIDLNFPETKQSGNEMSFPLRFGRRPGASNTSTPMILQTDDETTFSLEGKNYEQLVSFIEHRHPISAINKAVIRVGFVVFADGTGWSGGTFYRQDPNNPNRYIPAGESKNARSNYQKEGKP